MQTKPLSLMHIASTVRSMPHGYKAVEIKAQPIAGDFKLRFKKECYGFTAYFTKVEGHPELMGVRTFTGKLEDEFCGYYSITDARQIYSRLVALGFEAF